MLIDSPENQPMKPLTKNKTLGISSGLLLMGIVGTGSIYDTMHSSEWIDDISYRVHYAIETTQLLSPDLRTPAQHLENIRHIFNIPISNIADLLHVSRQAVYKWLAESSIPEPEKQNIITKLSKIADQFRESNITRVETLLTMKTFDGKSLIDIILSGENPSQHIAAVIQEARIMQASYEKSLLSLSKAKATNDWRSYISIPGSLEKD